MESAGCLDVMETRRADERTKNGREGEMLGIEERRGK